MQEIDPYLLNVPMVNSKLDFDISNNQLTVRFQHQSRIQKILRKIGFKIPTETILDFDEISQFVFQQIDGQRNIYEIGQLVSKKYGEQAEPLYERLVTFIDYLESTKRWVLFKNKIK